MQQVDSVTSVPLGQSYVNSNGTSNLYFSNWPISSLKVVSSPVIKGNRKSANPWSYSVNRLRLDVCADDYYRESGGYWYHQVSRFTKDLSSSLSTDALLLENEEKLTEKLYEKLRGSLDLSVDAFQARQTAKMFSLSNQLTTFFPRRKVSALKRAGSAWLQYVYGWRPLAGTIYGAIEESRRIVCNRINTIEVRSRTSSSDFRKVNSANPSGSKEVSVRRQRAVIQKIRASYALPGFDLARWTSLNPVSIAWELLPYSFVVDWVYDVGGYLRQLESAVLYSSSFRGGFKSTLLVQDESWKDRLSISESGSTIISSSTEWGGARTQRSFSRTILTSTPYPKPPRLNLSLGSGRLLNAAALLSQRLR